MDAKASTSQQTGDPTAATVAKVITAQQSILNALGQMRAGGSHIPVLVQSARGKLAAHAKPQAVVSDLMHAGLPLELSTALVGMAANGLSIGDAAPPAPREDYATAHTETHMVEGRVRVLASMGIGGVDIRIFDGLISNKEIEHIKAAAAGNMRPATVMNDKSGIGSYVDQGRVSDVTYLPRASDPTLKLVEERISRVVGQPLVRAEGLQVLHYRHAGQYTPHWDYFVDKSNPAAQVARCGDRVGTVILYLNDCERGGSTYFPQLDLAIHPHKGMAFWFGYADRNPRSKHAGMPVLKGEKWIATEWYRERVF
ncbi:MAG TPA: 2OG-Fe(II) oxygenase [Rhodanobacteraceae bacterium]